MQIIAKESSGRRKEGSTPRRRRRGRRWSHHFSSSSTTTSSSALLVVVVVSSSSSSLLPLLPYAPVVYGQQQRGYYCGASWVDAVSLCDVPCPAGSPSECPLGETCFAGTPCVVPSSTYPPPPAAVATPPPIAAFATTTTTEEGEGWEADTTGTATTTTSAGTCGNGLRGDGTCPDPNDCCSIYGYCGTDAEHCSSPPSSATPPPAVVDDAASAGGGAQSSSSCGGGTVGNGICPNAGECCSEYGFCGTSIEHCAGGDGGGAASTSSSESESSPPQFQPSTAQLEDQGATTTTAVEEDASSQVYGTCGNGDTGNGICATNAECCTSTGFCGSTLEHCADRVGPLMPGQPDYYDDNNGGAAAAAAVDASGTTTTTFDQQQEQQEQGGGGSSNMDREPTTSGTTSTTTTTAAASAAPHGTARRIIGYYAGWQWYDRDKLADPENMDFRKVQRVNYAFFRTDALGNIYGTDRWGDPQLLFGPYSTLVEGGIQRCSYDGPSEVNCAYHAKRGGLIQRAHEQGAEVYPSIGGWTLSDNYPTMSADPVARDAFARKCVEILSYYDFDGIDIDWEYPGYADHSGTPADTENFTRMLTAIRAALELHSRETGRVYGLTAALPCAPENIANIEVGKLVHVLSEFNLMSYDFHGSWDNVTGTNAPLYYQGFGNEEFNIDRCVENYVALGVPRGKINIGLPFYGRSFKFATSLNQKHGGSDVANWPEDDGTPQYFNIRKKLPHMMQVRDNKSKTQYAYISHAEQEQQQQQQIQQILSPGGRRIRALAEVTDTLAQSSPEGLVSFDDERAICDKVHYAQEKELGGFIVWEMSGDVLEDLSTPLLDVANMKLAHPSFECCTLHSEEECERERMEAEMANSQMMGFDVGGWTSSSGWDESGCEGGYRVASILRLSLGVIAATTVLFW
ncbi:hypothetical protein ACHAW5_001511 [Stephanodiscus triporus]|uniref:Chitinase n=1 Tax=Stephanodiscus triporus TaxID=2934178 RepID=A0ABD3NGW6_9STRA